MKDYSKFEGYKKGLLSEIKIKEMLINRHQHYGEVLKAELATAKNIIKDPESLKKKNREMNYQTVQLYPIKTVGQQLNTDKNKEKKKIFKTFEFFKEREPRNYKSLGRHTNRIIYMKKEGVQFMNKSLQKFNNMSQTKRTAL